MPPDQCTKWAEEFDERFEIHKRQQYWLTGGWPNDHGRDTDSLGFKLSRMYLFVPLRLYDGMRIIVKQLDV